MQTDRQTARQTDRQTDRVSQSVSQTGKQERQISSRLPRRRTGIARHMPANRQVSPGSSHGRSAFFPRSN